MIKEKQKLIFPNNLKTCVSLIQMHPFYLTKDNMLVMLVENITFEKLKSKGILNFSNKNEKKSSLLISHQEFLEVDH